MKYFYSDPLVAAWMARHFGMKFEIALNGFAAQTPDNQAFINDFIYSQTHGVSDSPVKYYINSDSLYLLKPQLGDMVLDEDSINGISIELPMQVEQCKDSRIIMRGDLAFMTPECEK